MAPLTPPTQSPSIDSTVDAVDFTKSSIIPKPTMSPTTEDPRKAEVISELESKIKKSSSPPLLESPNKPDEELAPKIAPVENSLSNFTITTYGCQKNLDIFEPIESENVRSIGSFATLTRGRSIAAADFSGERKKNVGMKNAQSIERINGISVNVGENNKDLGINRFSCAFLL